ncbi:MAG: hypothetical protein Q7S19_03520 [bacterium]|nr:hypothetical protein [bacterium]
MSHSDDQDDDIEVDKLYERLLGIIRSYWNYTDVSNVQNYDELTVAVADRELALIYPPGKMPTFGRPFNRTSPLNFLLAAIASICTVSSLVVFAGMAFTLLAVLTVGETIWVLPSIIAAHYILTPIIALSVFTAGAAIRRVDKRITREKLLKQAKRKLKDPKLNYEEQCYLKMVKVNARISEALAPWKAKLLEYKEVLKQVEASIKNVKDVDSINSAYALEKASPSMILYVQLIEKIKRVQKKIAEIEDKGANADVEFLASQALAPLITAGDKIKSVSDGTMDQELEALQSLTKKEMTEIDRDIQDINDELLIRIGLPQIEEKKSGGSEDPTK